MLWTLTDIQYLSKQYIFFTSLSSSFYIFTCYITWSFSEDKLVGFLEFKNFPEPAWNIFDFHRTYFFRSLKSKSQIRENVGSS